MTEQGASRFEQYTVQEYARALRPHLPAEIFRPRPARLGWLPAHLAVIIGLAAYIVGGQPPWYVALACALVAGHSWACLGFLAHEVLHHAVVRNRAVERLVGYCGLLIFCLSPTLWIAWHNQQHHGNTGSPAADPDHFGTLASWRESAADRVVVDIAPGSRRKRSALFLFFTFSVHSAIVLLAHSRRGDYYARVSRRTVYLETAAMVAFWLAVAVAVGAWSFLFIGIVPALIANAVAMSYIATNHFLNPLTAINDPLVNSLSVRGPRWVEWLHLHFGYHVEHHIFPTVSARHGRTVRAALVRLYGDRYLSLPHGRALRLLYTRPKVHRDHDTLIDPRTLRAFQALAPGDLSMAALAD
ncbi:fatty acid desaturase [bacterium]|nr:fatty acid desaturase [bacterium]